MVIAPMFFVVMSAVVDIGANLMLEKSQSFTRKIWGFGAIAMVWLAFFLLGQAVVDMDLSVAYTLWGGIGVIGTAILGRILLGQRLNPVGWLGIALIVSAVAVLQMA